MKVINTSEWQQVDHCTWSKLDFLIIRRMDGFYMLTVPAGDAYMDTSLSDIESVKKWADQILERWYRV